MRLLIRLYHFLGGIVFALILIAAVAIFVVAGTVIESVTQSHRFAAGFTYSHPVFIALLAGFFINILFSATRRWPFQVKHVPFLITHLGLLMLLAGVLVKAYFGRQGTMDIMEGSASHEIFESERFFISAESRQWPTPHHFELKRSFWGDFVPTIDSGEDGPEIRLASYYPHSSERVASWFKGSHAHINGLAPLPVHEIDDPKSLKCLPVSGRAEFSPGTAPWNLCAIRTADSGQMTDKLYQLTARHGSPCLALIEDAYRDAALYVYDGHGQVWSASYPNTNLSSLMSYDGGYGGYTVQAALPSLTYEKAEREKAIKELVCTEIKEAVAANAILTPPLQLLHSACQKSKVDFPLTLAEFLVHWDSTHRWLYPHEVLLPPSLTAVFSHLEWDQDGAEWQACHWIARFFEQIEPDLQQGKDIIQVLREKKWPLVEALEMHRNNASEIDNEDVLNLLARQIFSAAEELKARDTSTFQEGLAPEAHARLYSVYLRAYGIHLNPPASHPEGKVFPLPDQSEIVLETSVLPVHQPLPPETKLEDNVPKITLYVREGSQAEMISLSYDTYAQGLKWPVLNGRYLLRFQPCVAEIPYRIRLRNARQINYANSSQTFSYECDVIVTERSTGRNIEKTISMNQVHETWDGYRFYLSSIAPPTEGAVKHVHIVVNHDPAKYLLTYPGALILSIGIALLFWLRPYSKHH